MQLLLTELINMEADILGGQVMTNNNVQFYNKFMQMGYTNPASLLSPRLRIQQLEDRPRRRRSNHSLVATMDPVAVARRNERERNRVKQVNDGFDALRKKVPFLPDKKKLSKVEILRYAMMYINDLKCVVEEFDHNNLLHEHKLQERNNICSTSTDDDDECILLEQEME